MIRGLTKGSLAYSGLVNLFYDSRKRRSKSSDSPLLGGFLAKAKNLQCKEDITKGQIAK